MSDEVERLAWMGKSVDDFKESADPLIQLQGIEDIASAYTPVPGGVGPMTITTLIRQTVEAAEKALG